MKNNEIGHDDPANWKWGIFYYNKKDTRLFPPKKIVFMGWTVNFANPLSVLAFVAMMAAVLIFSFYLKKLFPPTS